MFEYYWTDIVSHANPTTAWNFYRTCKQAISMYRCIRDRAIKTLCLEGMEEHALLADWVYRRLVSVNHHTICLPRNDWIHRLCLRILRSLLRKGKRVALLGDYPRELADGVNDVFDSEKPSEDPKDEACYHVGSKIILGSPFNFNESQTNCLALDYIIFFCDRYYFLSDRYYRRIIGSNTCHVFKFSSSIGYRDRDIEYNWVAPPRTKPIAMINIIQAGQVRKAVVRDTKKHECIIMYSDEYIVKKPGEPGHGFLFPSLSGAAIEEYAIKKGTASTHSWEDVKRLVSVIKGPYSLYIRLTYTDFCNENSIWMLERPPTSLTLVYNNSEQYIWCRLFVPQRIYYTCSTVCVKKDISELRRGLGNALYNLTYWEIKYMFVWSGETESQQYARRKVLEQPTTTIPMDVMDKIAVRRCY